MSLFKQYLSILFNKPYKVAAISWVISVGVIAILEKTINGEIAPLTIAIATFCSICIAYPVSKIYIHQTEIIHKKNEELDLINGELEAFAHTVAYDLKNQLNVVVGFSGILADNEEIKKKPELQEQLGTIKKH